MDAAYEPGARLRVRTHVVLARELVQPAEVGVRPTVSLMTDVAPAKTCTFIDTVAGEMYRGLRTGRCVRFGTRMVNRTLLFAGLGEVAEAGIGRSGACPPAHAAKRIARPVALKRSR